MDISYSYIWDDDSLGAIPEIDGKADYVVIVNWRYRATYVKEDQTEIIKDDYGQETLKVNEEQTDFIPFNELTSEIVEGWLNQDIQAMQEKLALEIEKVINPPIVYPPLPWATPTDNAVN
jgi:hypothetical protein